MNSCIRNVFAKERIKKGRNKQKDSVTQCKKLESESQSVPVYWLRSVSGKKK